jgi:hypothetical protein
MKCPNCKENYKFTPSDDKYYKVHFIHHNTTCSFGIEIYHHSEDKAKEAAVEHILNKFSWITKGHVFLRK